MLIRLAAIQSDVIQRLARATGSEPGGRRRAVLVGAQLGLLWAVIGRVWMRLISEEQVFSVGGTIFILLVVTGFGAAAGYAFHARRSTAASRAKRWWHRLLAYVPFLGMGPFVIFFLGHFAYAWRMSRPQAGRFARILLGAAAIIVPAFWTLVFVSQEPSGAGWASAILYLTLGYLLYVSLRFALEPSEAARTVTPPPAALA